MKENDVIIDDLAAETDEDYGFDTFDTKCGDIIEKYLAKSGCEGARKEGTVGDFLVV